MSLASRVKSKHKSTQKPLSQPSFPLGVCLNVSGRFTAHSKICICENSRAVLTTKLPFLLQQSHSGWRSLESCVVILHKKCLKLRFVSFFVVLCSLSAVGSDSRLGEWMDEFKALEWQQWSSMHLCSGENKTKTESATERLKKDPDLDQLWCFRGLNNNSVQSSEGNTSDFWETMAANSNAGEIKKRGAWKQKVASNICVTGGENRKCGTEASPGACGLCKSPVRFRLRVTQL